MLRLVCSGEEQQTLRGLCGKSFHGFAPLARPDPADRKVLKVLSCLQLVSRKEMTCCEVLLQTRRAARSQHLQHGGTMPRAAIVKNPLNKPETVSVSDLNGLIQPKNLRFELFCVW